MENQPYNSFESARSQAFLEGIDNLLSQALTTHLQSKAKSIIMSGLEFIATDIAIALSVTKYRNESNIIHYGMFGVLGLAALYVIVLGVFLFIHAIFHLKKNTRTSEKVADAFTKTNQIPVLDGCLELPFPSMYKGSTLWFLPYICWSIFVVLTLGGATLFYFQWEALSNAVLAELSAGFLLLYQISSDFLEYWVLSRNQVEIEKKELKEDIEVTTVGISGL